jgi:hypothetical protein
MTEGLVIDLGEAKGAAAECRQPYQNLIRADG